MNGNIVHICPCHTIVDKCTVVVDVFLCPPPFLFIHINFSLPFIVFFLHLHPIQVLLNVEAMEKIQDLIDTQVRFLESEYAHKAPASCSRFVSSIRFSGKPILPPLVSQSLLCHVIRFWNHSDTSLISSSSPGRWPLTRKVRCRCTNVKQFLLKLASVLRWDRSSCVKCNLS